MCGDLTCYLTRSVTATGILVPLLVLPANSDGVHQLVAGHRRHQAAVNAKLVSVPVLIRDLTPLQVLDAMLVENEQRSSLAASDSIRAVARYQYLDPGSTPTRIARRIGRTPAWVKTRLEIASLPLDVLERVDTGELTLTAASAVAAVVDLGDDAVRAAAEHVARWRRRYQADRQVEQLLAKSSANGGTVYDNPNAAHAAGAVELGWNGLGLEDAAQKAHRREPCHAVSVKVDWNDKVQLVGYCTDRKRHRSTTTKPSESAITAAQSSGNRTADRPGNARDKQIANARTERQTAAATLFAAGKLPKPTAVNFAALTLIDSLDSLAVKKVVKWIGLTCGDGSAQLTARSLDGSTTAVNPPACSPPLTSKPAARPPHRCPTTAQPTRRQPSLADDPHRSRRLHARRTRPPHRPARRRLALIADAPVPTIDNEPGHRRRSSR